MSRNDERTACQVIRDEFLRNGNGADAVVPQLGLGATLVRVGHGGWFTPIYPPEVPKEGDSLTKSD